MNGEMGTKRDSDALHRPERYPLSSRYSPSWVRSLDMGPHPLWQLEDLLADLALVPGMRVLDLGAGKGATSVFLARECHVEVVALDLWIPAEQARAVHAAAGVTDRVTAVQGDIRTLDLDETFDAIVSVDAFEYFGTDVQLLPKILKSLRPGGQLAISTPGLRSDPYETGIPGYVEAVVGWEAAAWHSPAWWAMHWKLSGLVDNVLARWQVGGRADWLLWSRALGAGHRAAAPDPIVAMLEADTDEQLGFVLLSARKPSASLVSG